MIDDALIDTYPTAQRDAIVDALHILRAMGVFTTQVARNTAQIVDGFSVKDADSLAKEILQVQQTNRQLLALHELAGRIKKGTE